MRRSFSAGVGAECHITLCDLGVFVKQAATPIPSGDRATHSPRPVNSDTGCSHGHGRNRADGGGSDTPRPDGAGEEVNIAEYVLAAAATVGTVSDSLRTGGGSGVRVSRRWKIVIGVIAGAGIALTPLYWLLDGPGAGQSVAGSVQCAIGIIALVWAVFMPSGAPPPVPGDSAANTGKARAAGDGRAVTGVRRPPGAGSSAARSEQPGDASTRGPGSTASTRIDYP